MASQKESLDALRHRLPDYLAVRGMELRRNGTRLVGRCPNHDDANPSFAVFGTPSRNLRLLSLRIHRRCFRGLEMAGAQLDLPRGRR